MHSAFPIVVEANIIFSEMHWHNTAEVFIMWILLCSLLTESHVVGLHAQSVV